MKDESKPASPFQAKAGPVLSRPDLSGPPRNDATDALEKERGAREGFKDYGGPHIDPTNQAEMRAGLRIIDDATTPGERTATEAGILAGDLAARNATGDVPFDMQAPDDATLEPAEPTGEARWQKMDAGFRARIAAEDAAKVPLAVQVTRKLAGVCELVQQCFTEMATPRDLQQPILELVGIVSDMALQLMPLGPAAPPPRLDPSPAPGLDFGIYVDGVLVAAVESLDMADVVSAQLRTPADLRMSEEAIEVIPLIVADPKPEPRFKLEAAERQALKSLELPYKLFPTDSEPGQTQRMGMEDAKGRPVMLCALVGGSPAEAVLRAMVRALNTFGVIQRG